MLDLTDRHGVDCRLRPRRWRRLHALVALPGAGEPHHASGLAGGEIPQIPVHLLLAGNITACGLNTGYYDGWSLRDMRHEFDDRMRANMQQLLDWFEGGRIDPVVARTYALED